MPLGDACAGLVLAEARGDGPRDLQAGGSLTQGSADWWARAHLTLALGSLVCTGRSSFGSRWEGRDP